MESPVTHTCFDVRIADDIAHVVLNRPEKRNSINAAFWAELPQIVQEIDDGAQARVIVISSTGPHFCAGLDLSAFAGGSAPDDGLSERQRRLQRGAAFYETALRSQRSFNALEDCRIPVLAAIQGGAIGGGVDLAVACDMRYATEDAFLTIFETNIALTADVGTFPRLCKLLPEGIVRELAYTGRRMSAREALERGLVNRVFPDHASMLAGVMEVAAEIATKAPLAVAGCKRMINYARDHSTADALDYIAIWNASMFQTEEIREALAANGEKRRGDFASLPKRRR